MEHDTVPVQRVFEQIPQAVLLADADLRLFWSNPAAQSLTRLSSDRLKGAFLLDLLDPLDRERFPPLHAQASERWDGFRQVNTRFRREGLSPATVELRFWSLEAGPGRAWVILVNDVTAAQEALAALRRNEERYRSMVEACPDGIALLKDGVVHFANGALEGLLGLEGPEALWGSELESFVHPDDVPLWQKLLERTLGGAGAQAREVRMVLPEGKLAELEFTGLSLDIQSGEALMLARDIRQRKHMERLLKESEERYKGLADVAFDGLAVHVDGVILNVNRSFEAIFPAAKGGLLGANLFELFTEDSSALLKAGMDSGRVLELEADFPGEGMVYVEASTRACLFHGEPAYVTALRDVTRRRRTENVVRRQAWYDALTGLPNRILFLDRLEHALDQAKREGRRVGVLFLDLDRFKSVNDSLGHAAGDQLLQAAAGRLQGLLRKSDTVARLGGDEFTVLIEDPVLAADALGVSRKIVDALSLPFTLGAEEVRIGASVGLAFYPDHAGDPERLLKLADMAMYQAKKNGRNQAAVYAETLEGVQGRRLGLESELRRALERGEFTLLYQAQVGIAGGRVEGAEALLRWQHPDRGLLLPEEFIPLAEESRLIVPLGEWALFEACRQAAAWEKGGLPLSVSVPLSAWQLNRRSLQKTVDAALNASHLDAAKLELQISEAAAMRDPARALVMLRAFAHRGVRLSLDDFGRAYSSLSYLKDIPVQTIKVDPTFIQDLPSDPKSAAILRAVIALAHSLGLACLARGLEQPEQLAFLKEEGCDLGQGNLLFPPLEAEALRTQAGRAQARA